MQFILEAYSDDIVDVAKLLYTRKINMVISYATNLFSYCWVASAWQSVAIVRVSSIHFATTISNRSFIWNEINIFDYKLDDWIWILNYHMEIQAPADSRQHFFYQTITFSFTIYKMVKTDCTSVGVKRGHPLEQR